MSDMSHHCAPSTVTLSPLGILESDFPDKFGVPRQPGLAPSARATLRLLSPYDDPLTVRGLDAFSHLWLTFVFHQSPERWSALVRPPRLGGNRRVGVFASRSTHRPNRLGLSLVELLGVDTRGGVRLHLAGADLISGTPVLDIKPYLPWAEARPDARAGFAPEAPRRLPVHLTHTAETALARREDAASLRRLIEEVLSQDPRPAYRHDDETRRYGVRLRDLDIHFRIATGPDGTNILEVLDIQPA